MRLDAKRAALAAVMSITLFLNPSLALANEVEFQVGLTVLTVYRDGLVHVNQTVAVNETFPSVTLPLLASSVENLIVVEIVDGNRTVLDYEMYGSNLTVYSLGARTVQLEYDTALLTVKEAGLWTLTLDAPFNLTVFLPEESIVMYLSQIPTSIETEDTRIKLSLFPGHWEVSYEVPLLPPAEFVVSDLRVTPAIVEAGEEVTVSVKVTNIGGEAGSYIVALKIGQVTEETRTVIIDGGGSTTVEFRVTSDSPGTYGIEVAGLSGEFVVTETPSTRFPTEYVAAAVTAVAAAFILAFFLLRRKPPSAGGILRAHPYLRQEDRDVIQFLEEKGGKAFEAEIRERFPDMPRTSLWRLVKRLEKMDIVRVRRIGLENQVELKK